MKKNNTTMPFKAWKKPPTDINGRKIYAIHDIDEYASIIRSAIVTPFFGQEAIYAEKTEEAIDYATGNYMGDLSNYPLIAAEVRGTGAHPRDIAETIIKKKADWIEFNAKIEEVRLRAKMEINAEENITISEINNIKDRAINTLKSLL